jgi:hypothetical protein
MNIGFDLDKVFVSLPPLIPSKVIDLFYKGKVNHKLKYRTPSKLEQIIRIASHTPLLRSPIIENLEYIKKLNSKNVNKYYLVSSRFGFLKKRTDDLIKKHNLDKIFNAMYFNYENKQPHQFKNEIIKKLNLDMFVDDDLQLLEYLIAENPKIKFFWLNNKISKTLKKNLLAIRTLSEMFK